MTLIDRVSWESTQGEPLSLEGYADMPILVTCILNPSTLLVITEWEDVVVETMASECVSVERVEDPKFRTLSGCGLVAIGGGRALAIGVQREEESPSCYLMSLTDGVLTETPLETPFEVTFGTAR
ncbi:hypothetical protein KIPB_009184 [Kipferlia bialata]|uniref:Uncharacterized protein n=1 Tax=Kipferlia bialata TaxID=797122 RepID=A0A9K3D3Y5_9EUKA|nr:hypothetical protein KIPB_009184 [Kipferlia bialata]|eukprot:g9184.t1